MLPIVSKHGHSVTQSDGGNGDVGIGKGLALLLPVPAQQTGLADDFRGDGQVFETVEKGCGFVLFAGPETGIHLGEVHRATGQNVPLLDELLQEIPCGQTAR
jgi:hypothetical protein